jgi:cystathionine beta-synthase
MPVIQAIKNMRLYDISQMAVLDEYETVVGILDESDILLAVVQNSDNFLKPVSEFMTKELSTLNADSCIEDLMPLFAEDKVAIVFDNEKYLGLITKIDLITHLRKQLPR